MKARERSPAVTSATAMPRKQRGGSAHASRSRRPEKMTSAKPKPSAAAKENRTDSRKGVRAVLAVQLRHAQHRAVRGDERQEDAERGVERRHESLHRDVDELHERGDHEDERERVDVAEAERDEEPVVEAPRDGRGDRHDEDDGAGHAEGRLRLLRHAQERTTSKKAVQNEVVHENRADDDDKISHDAAHYTTPIHPPQADKSGILSALMTDDDRTGGFTPRRATKSTRQGRRSKPAAKRFFPWPAVSASCHKLRVLRLVR